MWTLIGSAQNADRDLTTEVTVWTGTPDASQPRICAGAIYLGDGAKDLDGSGGNFTLRVLLGSQAGPGVAHVLAAAGRAWLDVPAFYVPANTAVALRVLSPNAGDTDVDVTAHLAMQDRSVVLAADGLDAIATTGPGDLWPLLAQLGRPHQTVATDRRGR